MRVIVGKYDIGFPESISTEKEAVDFVNKIYPELDTEAVKSEISKVFKNVATKPKKVEIKSAPSESKDGTTDKPGA